jgi:hypothetical protein
MIVGGRFRVWINDSAGTHTPSYPFGSQRAAEVFAANRSRFRRDCFVLVLRDGEQKWLAAYRNGYLHDTNTKGAFKPEPVIIRDAQGAIYYGLLEAGLKTP